MAHPHKCLHEFSPRGGTGGGAWFRTSERLRLMACSWHMQLYRGGEEGEREGRGGAKGSDRTGPVTFMEISPHSLRKPDLWTTFRRSMNLVSRSIILASNSWYYSFMDG